jgi:hypothetical protein
MNSVLLQSTFLQGDRQTKYFGVTAPDYFVAILNVDSVFSDLLSMKQTVILTVIIMLNEDYEN